MNKRRTVSVVYLGPPGSMGFDQQYKVQLTDIHQWCPSEVKTGADTGQSSREPGRWTKYMLSKAAGDTQRGVEHADDTSRRYPGTAMDGQSKGYPTATKTGRLKA